MLLYCRLQSAGLLPHDGSIKISHITSTELGVSELLDAIEEMINSDPRNFYKFVDELEKDTTMWTICNKLWSTGEHSVVFWCNLTYHLHRYITHLCMMEYNACLHILQHYRSVDATSQYHHSPLTPPLNSLPSHLLFFLTQA